MMKRDKPERAIPSIFFHFKKVKVEVNDLIGVLNVD